MTPCSRWPLAVSCRQRAKGANGRVLPDRSSKSASACGFVNHHRRNGAPPWFRRSREQAQKEGEALLLQQLKTQLDEDAVVTETRFSAAVEGDSLVVVLQAECLEQIGRPVQVQAEE